ncbi:MAG: hypothetical protein ABI144_11030 [Gallionella sp.]
MTTITQYFEQAQLSLAAYAVGLQKGMSNADYIAALKAAGMSDIQTADFAKTYTVVDQYTDSGLSGLTDGSGFSATVFQDNGNPPQYFLAIRGTDFTSIADLNADVNLATGTLASAQLIAMVNFCLRLQAGDGVLAPQLTDATTRSSTGAYGIGPGISLSNLTVTGHSLGGYLGELFEYLFGGGTSQLFTYNAPGFLGDLSMLNQITNTLDLPAGTFATVQANNLVVPDDAAHDVGVVPGLQTQTPIFSETNVPGALIAAHRIVPMTDSLAVYKLFAQLDPALNTDPNGMQTITDILNAESNIATNSLKSSITELDKLFGVANTTLNGGQFDLYQAIDGFSSVIKSFNGPTAVAPTIQSLVGMDAATLVANAQTDIAYRYALVNLNPFVAEGMNYSGFDTTGALDLNTSANPTGQFTEQYLNDRKKDWGQVLHYSNPSC